MLQAIEREKAEKFRKLQDASRTAQALMEQNDEVKNLVKDLGLDIK